jgi:hypothetical protein
MQAMLQTLNNMQPN